MIQSNCVHKHVKIVLMHMQNGIYMNVIDDMPASNCINLPVHESHVVVMHPAWQNFPAQYFRVKLGALKNPLPQNQTVTLRTFLPINCRTRCMARGPAVRPFPMGFLRSRPPARSYLPAPLKRALLCAFWTQESTANIQICR